MRLITRLIHPSLTTLEGNVFRRQAARGIVLRDEAILLLFTERYNDFSFPGGGVDAGEDLVVGLRRELEEETGATNIRVVDHYGYVDEFRPHWKPPFDLMHMTSHFYTCEIDVRLGESRMEHYERDNGMRPVWVNLREAIAHNRAVMRRQDKSMGLSIYRETYMLEKVAEELLDVAARPVRRLEPSS